MTVDGDRRRRPFRFAAGAVMAGAACTVIAVACAAPVYAQTGERPVRRVEVSIGGGWFGGADLGTADANVRGNTTPAQPLRLFSTRTRMAGAPSLHADVGFAFTRRWSVEGGVVLSRPELRTSISADAEGAPPLTAVEGVDQYLIEGRVVIMLEEIRLGSEDGPVCRRRRGLPPATPRRTDGNRRGPGLPRRRRIEALAARARRAA